MCDYVCEFITLFCVVSLFQAVQFGSDLGGTFGLWLGASIITIVELVDLCVRLCHFCYKKKQYNKGTVNTLCNIFLDTICI